jgi:hypothetical protein
VLHAQCSLDYQSQPPCMHNDDICLLYSDVYETDVSVKIWPRVAVSRVYFNVSFFFKICHDGKSSSPRQPCRNIRCTTGIGLGQQGLLKYCSIDV